MAILASSCLDAIPRLSYRPIFRTFCNGGPLFPVKFKGSQKISLSFQPQPMRGQPKNQHQSWAPTTKQQQNQQNQWKSANSANQHTPANSLLVQPAVAAFPGAIQPSQGPASLPRGQPAASQLASQQSPRGQPAVSQSTSQNGIIHTHLDHVNMSQCTFSFYVICYLYWFGCVSFLSAVSFTFQLE